MSDSAWWLLGGPILQWRGREPNPPPLLVPFQCHLVQLELDFNGILPGETRRTTVIGFFADGLEESIDCQVLQGIRTNEFSYLLDSFLRG